MTAVLSQVPYLGVCFTEHHVNVMLDHLAKQVYADMQREGNPLYQASMVVQLETKTGKDEAGGEDVDDNEASGTTKNKNKGKGNAKAQPKKQGQKNKKVGGTSPKESAKKKPKKNKKDADGDDGDLDAALKDLEDGALDGEEDMNEEEEEEGDAE